MTITGGGAQPAGTTPGVGGRPADPVERFLTDASLGRMIGDGGRVADSPGDPGLEPAQLGELLRRLVLLRVFDERAVAFQRQGRLGTYPLYWGEEAVQVGAMASLRPDDWVFPSYRQAAIGLLRGQDPEWSLRLWRGDARGFTDPASLRIAPLTTPIATHLPHAVGLAWAAAARGDDVASLAFFGDGATSAGDFHEAMNLAGVLHARTVFLCTNNQWAISTPVSRQTVVTALAEKAHGYGIPAVRVDGFDVLAVAAAVREAVGRAHGGGGPSFVEAVTYRLGPHGTADDPALYRGEAEAAAWRRLEPVARFRGWLERHGLYEDGLEERLRAEARELVARSIARIEADAAPAPRILVDGVYATPPAALVEGLDRMIGDRDRYGGTS